MKITTIKKIIYTIIITTVVLIFGYLMFFYPRQKEPPGFHQQRLEAYPQTHSSSGRECKVVEIENCEYLEFNTSVAHYGLTHKGNCKNPIHYNPTYNNLNNNKSTR